MISASLIVRAVARFPQLKRLIVGYSGGVDSHVLLHLCARARSDLGGIAVEAAHVNHALSANAGDWQTHCEAVCAELQLQLHSIGVDARAARGESPEAAARNARYAALKRLLDNDSALLTAHHQDDQAETLLLQLLRGAGPRGLGAMNETARLHTYLHLRPLLLVSGGELKRYARHHRLRWIDDDSNVDMRFDRNYLRHEVLPVITARWPAATRCLGRSATLAAQAAELIDQLAGNDFADTAGSDRQTLRLELLCALDGVRIANVIRYWLRLLRLPAPSKANLDRIMAEVLPAAADRRPMVCWPGVEVRRYRNLLYAMAPLPAHDSSQRLRLTGAAPLQLAGIGSVRMVPATGSGLRLPGHPLSIGFRRGGEWFRPHRRQHRLPLKKLLQESGIPPWQRDRLPLLYCGAELVAVADLWLAADYVASNDPAAVVMQWQKPGQSVNV